MNDRDTDKDSTFFVSRRGKQVGVHEVNLRDIDIDNQPETKQGNNTQKSKDIKKEKRPREKRMLSRKKITIIASVVLAILLVPVIVGELVAAEFRGGVTDAKEDLGAVISKNVLPTQKKSTITADELRAIASRVNAIGVNMCRGGMLDNMASLYPRAQQALEDCRASQAKYSTLHNRINVLESQARYFESVGTIIEPISTPITDAFAVISAQQDAWLAAADKLKKLTPREEMRTIHSLLVDHVAKTATAWSSLNTANNAQDAVAFTEAEKQLESQYAAIRSSSGDFSKIIADTQASLTTASNELK